MPPAPAVEDFFAVGIMIGIGAVVWAGPTVI
jgi:hypothetical protein